MSKTKSVGTLGDVMGNVPSVPKNEPITLMDVLGRVETLETALQMLIEELTALRASIERLEKTPPKAKPMQPKPTQPETTAAEKPQTKPTTPKSVHPWDDPKILTQLEACRPRILELLSNGEEVTKQGCADTLNSDPALVGRTISYMIAVTKEVQMISPPKTEDNPEPKKRFRLK